MPIVETAKLLKMPSMPATNPMTPEALLNAPPLNMTRLRTAMPKKKIVGVTLGVKRA